MLLTAKELAARAGVSSWTVIRWAKAGRIPYTKQDKQFYFDLDMIYRFLKYNVQN